LGFFDSVCPEYWVFWIDFCNSFHPLVLKCARSLRMRAMSKCNWNEKTWQS
jgi:hypothetical protein